MIGEIDPRGYDCEGRVTLLPKKKSMHFHPTAAMGTYLRGELAVRCESLEEIQAFLKTCRYVSDPEQFGVRDYWTHPKDFEVSRKGDCDCFALWTWRQLIDMGYDARFVLGRVGYGRWFHAWVTYCESGTHYLIEATGPRRKRLSRLGTMMYEPVASVGCSDGKLVYHQHKERDYELTVRESLVVAAEWIPLFLFRWCWYALRWCWYGLSLPWRFLRKRLGAGR